MSEPNPSPEPQYDEKIPAKRTTTGEIAAIVTRTAWHTKVQWVVVGSFLVGLGSFITYGLNKIDVVNSAMAQTESKAERALDATREAKAQMQMLDAGTRTAIERLEKKIDTNNEATDRKIDKVQQTMELVLKELKR